VSPNRPSQYLADLVRELCLLPNETEWVEFKRNNDDPEEIGEYISALANSAALQERPYAYLVWGIDDKTHDVVGTTVNPREARKGAEELESWLLRKLVPKLEFYFHEASVDGKRVVVLEIERTARQPVQFGGIEYIRVGSYKKPLKEYAEKERALWRLFDRTPFEDGVASENLSQDEVVELLDHAKYFNLVGRPEPAQREQILSALSDERLIKRNDAGMWNITNLGAILFAKELKRFSSLERKAARVIVYEGNDRTSTIGEQVGTRGYANGFRGLIAHIEGRLPANEVIERSLRRTVPMYPTIAIRELVANALIHQDFSIRGAGPTVEIFKDRMEITNPGAPLLVTERFLDLPPRSRNEALASIMRRMGICEERGSGIDKVVQATEVSQLPAPLFAVRGESTLAVLYAHRPPGRMDGDERHRDCYRTTGPKDWRTTTLGGAPAPTPPRPNGSRRSNPRLLPTRVPQVCEQRPAYERVAA